MDPVLVFRPFGTVMEIHAYVLFAVMGALTGLATALPLLKREGLPALRALGLLICMAAAFLLGARLFNFAVNPAAYGGSLHLYTLHMVGLSVYGGIFGSLIALLIWARAVHTDPWPVLDALVLPTGLAFALARVGCYLNGCCVGIATNSQWGVAFPLTERGQELLGGGILSLLGRSSVTLKFYPTQLFELALALLGLAPVLWLYFRRRLPRGAAFLIYGIWFSAMRLTILPLRSLPYREVVTNILYPMFYIALIFCGLFLLIRLYEKQS